MYHGDYRSGKIILYTLKCIKNNVRPNNFKFIFTYSL